MRETIYPFADKQKYVIPESLGLARIMWWFSVIGAGGTAGRKLLPNALYLLGVSIS
jgi:hypothetical protein